MYSIEVNNLTKIYSGNVKANDDITLKIEPGEIFCLLGANGAGKSTLIRQISTELKPTIGSLHVQGIDLTKNPVEVKKRTGIMPQVCELFKHLTVRQHVQIFSRIKGLREPRLTEAVGDVTGYLSIDRYNDRKIEELSLGQKKQVLLAIALVGNPPVLILDEPTTGLDPEAKNRVWRLLLKKKQQGITIFLTTHLLEEAELLSDRLGVILAGKIVHCGTIGSLRSLLPKKFEVKFKNHNGMVTSSKYFDELSSAFRFIEESCLDSFSLSSLPLEKIYFELVGKENEFRSGI